MSDASGHVLVTGSSTGIGRASVIHLAKLGFNVLAGVRKESDALAIEHVGGDNVKGILLDVTNPKQIAAALETTKKLCGEQGLAGLVNNAGIVVHGPVEFIPLDDWRRQFEVNVFGQIALTQVMLPLLRTRVKTAGTGSARIIIMSSIAGLISQPILSPYCASKYALEAVSDSLRNELRPQGIQVCLIEPGAIDTPIWNKAEANPEIFPAGHPARALYGKAIDGITKASQKSAKNAIPAERVARGGRRLHDAQAAADAVSGLFGITRRFGGQGVFADVGDGCGDLLGVGDVIYESAMGGCMKILPVIFEERKIRRIYDEKTETWYFSVVDIIQVLTQQAEYQAARNYWKVLKNRLGKEGSELVTSCNRLKLPADDGKMRLTDVASPETLLRLVQSVPSPKAEPIKLWLAKVGYERMQEMADPSRALDRARETWQKHGRSEKWIQQRMTGQETRNKLTDYWAGHEIKKGEEYAILTNIIHQEWSGITVQDHKEIKGLKSQNLRDHMSEAELIFTALAELSTRQIAETTDATGLDENKVAAKVGGNIAKKARLELEQKTGQKVVTGQNYLPPARVKKIKRLGTANG